MTTTNISPTSIVVEVLRGDNYDDWSACMKSYMLAQDQGQSKKKKLKGTN